MDKDKKQTTFTSESFASGLESKKSEYFLSAEERRKKDEQFCKIDVFEGFCKRIFSPLENRRRRELGIRNKISYENRSEAGLDTTQACKDVQWYPFKNTDTVAGKITEKYLYHLAQALLCPVYALDCLEEAEFYHKRIGCEKTIKIWKQLNDVIPMCSKLKVDRIVASTIGGYLIFDPDSIYSYIKFLETVKSCQEEESKVRNLIFWTTEIANRSLTFSSHLAKLHKTIKSINSKTSKPDLPSGSSAE